MANKIKFGLKNVYYAAITEGESGITYATPVRIPGGVNISLAPQGEVTEFYADDIKYFAAEANAGYQGDLEIALIPESFRTDILGETLDSTAKVLTENANTIAKPFALLFEFSGDENAVRHLLTYCTVARPNIAGSTKTNTIEPQTETLTITAAARADGIVKRCTTAATPTATYNGWFDAVWEPTPPSPGVG